MKEIKNSKQGFTLLELLVVVLIIGILAAIALPQYQLAVAKAKFATLKSNARAIKGALDRYYMANNTYTTNLQNLDIEINDNCVILANQWIYCRKIISGSHMAFLIGYMNIDNRMACMIESNVSNPIANKLCQQETGKENKNDNQSHKTYLY